MINFFLFQLNFQSSRCVFSKIYEELQMMQIIFSNYLNYWIRWNKIINIPLYTQMLFTHKNKEKVSSSRLNCVPMGICLICSNTKCNESTDHSFLSFQQLKKLAYNSRQFNPKIDQAKSKITEFYLKIFKSIKDLLENHCLKAQQSINRCYYNHLTQLKPFQIQTLCQVLENDARSLPSRRVLKLSSFLNQKCEERLQKKISEKNINEFLEIEQKIYQKMEKFSLSSIDLLLKKQVMDIEQIIDKVQNSTACSARSLKQSGNIEQVSNQFDVFEWKNLKIRSIVRNIVLNCKKISDPQFLLNLPKLNKFSKIIQFDAHENYLTHLSCIAINNYLPQLISLDLRANHIGNLGISKLKGMKHLKQFMVDENQISDQSMEQILLGFPSLEVFWADNNRITERGAFILYEKPILKICSVVGNPIDRSYCLQIKNMFSRKGLIYI